MLNIIFISFVIQISMNGFAGFDFGSDKKFVSQIILAKENAKLFKSTTDTIIYSGDKYNGIPIKYWYFIFNKNKLSSINLELAGDGNEQSIYFKSLKNTLTKTYGKHTTIDQNKNNLKIKWLFYFPQATETASTFIELNFSNNRTLTIKSGIN